MAKKNKLVHGFTDEEIKSIHELLVDQAITLDTLLAYPKAHSNVVSKYVELESKASELKEQVYQLQRKNDKFSDKENKLIEIAYSLIDNGEEW